jgi:16S rRNA (cytosine967-C5)-methyltransferase
MGVERKVALRPGAGSDSPRPGKVAVSRRLALRLLTRVEVEGLFAAPLLDRFLESSRLSSLDKALLTELVYGTLRWQGRLDAVISPLLAFPLSRMNPWLRNILRLGAYQLLFLDRIPAYAAVDEAVELASSLFSSRQRDFVNAVLRRIAENPPSFQRPGPSSPRSQWVAYYSHPKELIEKWIGDWGEGEAAALMEANNQSPYLGVQVNLLKAGRSQVEEALRPESESVEEGSLVPHFLRVKGLSGVKGRRAWERGWFQIMDEASALVAYLLRPQPGEEVLDACAGKGGKSILLAQLMRNEGRIVAVDRNGEALSRLRENAQRMGVKVIEPIMADLEKDARFLGECKFDRILLDAPCSGLGTLRRHPEIKWRKPLASLPRLQSRQYSLLEVVSSYLKSGGILVYATCSPEPEEDEEVVERFLRSHPTFRLQDPSPFLPRPCPGLITPRGWVRTFPHRQGTDAFFAALIRSCPG